MSEEKGVHDERILTSEVECQRRTLAPGARSRDPADFE